MPKVKKIIDKKLCLGCGLCDAVADCGMYIGQDGFYLPDITKIEESEDRKIGKICPAINVYNPEGKRSGIWGHYIKVINAWAADPKIRKSSSSGGVTSALAVYLLETHTVDGVLQVGCVEGDYLHNRLYVSRTRQQVMSHNSSRYAPADLFCHLFEILDKYPQDKFAFIGKPCDIAAIRNIQRQYPQYRDRIKYCLAIFCAGMPSYNATERAIQTFGHPGTPVRLRYRGDGWPGSFTVDYPDGESFKMSYNDSWGRILGRDLGLRCKICPDGIGLLADIASGDSWNTKDGYPDFTEGEGRNFCFIRTTEGKALFDAAVKNGYIETMHTDDDDVRVIQQYQYNRRRSVGWRIMAIQLVTPGLLKFKGLNMYRTALKGNWKKGLREAVGTLRRYLKSQRETIGQR